MAVIPVKVYKNVEWHLHNERAIVKKAVENRKNVLEEVLDGCGLKHDNGLPRGIGKHSDPTAVKAMILVRATEEVDKAEAWVQAIRETYEYFNGTNVGLMAASFYGRGITIKALASLMEIDEKTVDRLRDKFVCTCAIMAAARGLVNIEQREGA